MSVDTRVNLNVFARAAGSAGADKPDPRLVQVVLDRYDAAVSA